MWIILKAIEFVTRLCLFYVLIFLAKRLVGSQLPGEGIEPAPPPLRGEISMTGPPKVLKKKSWSSLATAQSWENIWESSALPKVKKVLTVLMDQDTWEVKMQKPHGDNIIGDSGKVQGCRCDGCQHQGTWNQTNPSQWGST